jgi:rRNA maturation RNase YbeY
MIEFQHIDSPVKINYEQTTRWLNNVIINENKNIGEIVFVFCTDEFLLAKNIKHLNHDFLTDVITFDYCDDNLIAGDVLISAERVKENAKFFKVKFLNELQRVMVHGLLHLLGYNDKTKKEREMMQKKEDYYLLKI